MQSPSSRLCPVPDCIPAFRVSLTPVLGDALTWGMRTEVLSKVLVPSDQAAGRDSLASITQTTVLPFLWLPRQPRPPSAPLLFSICPLSPSGNSRAELGHFSVLVISPELYTLVDFLTPAHSLM